MIWPFKGDEPLNGNVTDKGLPPSASGIKVAAFHVPLNALDLLAWKGHPRHSFPCQVVSGGRKIGICPVTESPYLLSMVLLVSTAPIHRIKRSPERNFVQKPIVEAHNMVKG